MVLGWKLADIPLAGHLWYIETYVECVLCFPLLKCIFRKDNKDNFKVRYYLIGLGVLYALIMDIQSIIRPETFFIQPYSVITPALCLWLIGSEIYNKKELIRGNRNVRYVALAIFILGNLIRSLAQRHIYMVEPTDLQLLMWNSCFGFVIASALAIFFLSIDLKNKTIRNVIAYLAKNTFGIYLIHGIVITLFSDSMIQKLLLAWCQNGEAFWSALLYTVVYGLFIFAISLCITIVLRILWTGIKRFIEQIWYQVVVKIKH